MITFTPATIYLISGMTMSAIAAIAAYRVFNSNAKQRLAMEKSWASRVLSSYPPPEFKSGELVYLATDSGKEGPYTVFEAAVLSTGSILYKISDAGGAESVAFQHALSRGRAATVDSITSPPTDVSKLLGDL